jgi:hypothetical protein
MQIATDLDVLARSGPVAPLARVGLRVLVALGGTVIVLAGLAMLVLPGPGLLTIVLGLGLLGREFPWAARLHGQVRTRLADAARAVRR